MTTRIIRFALAGAGAVLVAGAAVAMTASAAGLPLQPFAASSPSPKPSASPNARQQSCDAFVNHFAADLGKKPADVDAAAQKAFGQTIDDAVKSGQITQAQADQMKQKLAGQSLCSGAIGAIGRPPAGPGAGFGGGAEKSMFLADAAKALGMSTADLQSQLQSGKTIKDIATAKGMTEQQFRDALVAAVKADLDAQVKAGKLTQAQEDMVLNRLKTGPLPLWDAMPRPSHPKPTPTPTA